jgi:hypothetical protein
VSIIMLLQGGLGNQMFQYALGRRLADERNVPLVLDISRLGKKLRNSDTIRTFRLGGFNIRAQVEEKTQARWFSGDVLGDWGGKVYRRALWLIPENWRGYHREPGSHVFFPEIFNIGHRACLMGFWQSEKYFIKTREKLLKDFSLKEELTGRNQEFAQQIGAVNAVGIHIRRGDYVTNKITNEYHGVCPLEYYLKCVSQLEEEVEKPHYFVFTDDPSWARENLRLSKPMTVMDQNGAEKDYLDMHLMSLCKHFIIANSSFSWWGAWLAEYPEKIIYAPKIWIRDSSIDTRDFIPDGWRKI